MPLLRVKVVSASKLLALDSNTFGGGPSSDPYVRLTCGTETAKTKEVKKSLNPQWHEEFRFGEAVLLDVSTASLHFRVKDHNVLGPAEDLGEVTVALEPLLPSQWNKLTLPLETHTSMKKAASGELVVEIFLDPTQGVGTAALPPLSHAPSSTSDESTSADSPEAAAVEGDGSAAPAASPPAPWTFNVLAVSVLEGKGLKALDGDGADSTSDPFVTLTLGDDISAKPLKTKVHSYRSFHPNVDCWLILPSHLIKFKPVQTMQYNM
ncbi:hypothetical protein H257_19519 [Aphanomyces astaci]|uniref:C2 domain-containing protein n=1 Tax=Aphanomyces astaci TaxID=112090 RepID=W4F7X5_APHAT|nr:hypothetical protein H257_19519 [Aphanomyces astaci]ETV63555.1 hypothetical protein H257_19519 [Aphanomyces astaci]|eukprot:XP_009846961.1 hypothetical protein H257_19519 [Aphanomyces astaci]